MFITILFGCNKIQPKCLFISRTKADSIIKLANNNIKLTPKSERNYKNYIETEEVIEDDLYVIDDITNYTNCWLLDVTLDEHSKEYFNIDDNYSCELNILIIETNFENKVIDIDNIIKSLIII